LRKRSKRPSIVEYVISEVFYGVMLAAIAFGVSFAIGEYGIWVSQLWMLSREKTMKVFYLLVCIISSFFLAIPVYNRRYVQLLGSLIALAIFWMIVLRTLDPIALIFGG